MAMKIKQISKESNDKTIIRVVDTSSHPIADVQVLLIAKNNTHFHLKTSKDGRAVFEKIPIKTYTIFIAHSDYPAYVIEGFALSKDLEVTLKESDGFGSLIIPDRTGYIPNLEGRLNPILDTSDRTYLYADNIAIEGGKNQPVTFVVGEPFTLEDRNGVLMSVTFVRIQGDSSILQYKKIESTDNAHSDSHDAEALSFYMSTSKSVESQVTDLNDTQKVSSSRRDISQITNNQTFAIVVGGLLLLMIVYAIFRFSGVDLNNLKAEPLRFESKTSMVSSENKLPVFGSNYSQEGFNLKVPRGNTSSCVWTWIAGTGDIPGTQTTHSSSSALNSHHLAADFFNGRDFKVGCTNDYGEYYEGQFEFANETVTEVGE